MRHLNSDESKNKLFCSGLGAISRITRALFVSVCLFASQHVQAKHLWTKYSSAHFDLYTPENNGEYVAQTLIALEHARGFFEHTSFRSSLPRTTVIAFGSPEEYAAYRMNAGAYAFYQHSSQGDFILLQELDGQHTPAAIHEYVHFVLHGAGYQLPLWLNEGLADFYSTIDLDGTRVVVGRPSGERMAMAASERRMTVQNLLQVDYRSPYYNEPAKMQLFYARSWALVHMLSMDRQYSGQFSAFLQLIADGTRPEDCFNRIYGKTVQQVQSDLDEYLSKRSLPIGYYDLDLTSTPTEVRSAPLPQEQLDACLAMVLAASPFVSGAERKIEDLASAHPDSPQFEESLGYLAMRTGRTQDALNHFSRAVARNSTDPLAIYYYARLQRDAGVPDERIIPLLERVLALRPSDENARIDLGFTAANANQFELALSSLSSLKHVQPGMAYEVFYAMAYCQAKLNRLGEARRTGFQAKAMARTADQQRRADNLLKYLDQSESLAVVEPRAAIGD